ncbi:uncharacterized protein N7459_004044 [Penicillium hispanicum]|uniref:uncharacterized protein n=1 Tax=Penicillium hispanicum TaxID=1080232 RepID=UPI0025426902|nr:uncharacterized protein N7459_004044 [Penicillium hispanicum]KAJ5584244.1 hypothetical protein N7459_004044 [Penicillium hispanicum]
MAEQGMPGTTINTHGGAVVSGNLSANGDLNITHITTLPPFARSLYDDLFTAPEFFKQVQTELSGLILILEKSRENWKEFESDTEHRSVLENSLRDCHRVLMYFQEMKRQYDRVDSSTQATWEQMEWGKEELEEIRSRIISCTSTMNLLNTNAIRFPQENIENMLKTFITEVRTGKREKPVISNDSLAADKKNAGRDIRKELQSVGITAEIFAHKQLFIMSRLQSALSEDWAAPSKRERVAPEEAAVPAGEQLASSGDESASSDDDEDESAALKLLEDGQELLSKEQLDIESVLRVHFSPLGLLDFRMAFLKGGYQSLEPLMPFALQRVARHGCIHQIRTLQRAGVFIIAKDKEGISELHFAEVSSGLLFGFTALHFAVESNSKVAVRRLLQCGADIRAVEYSRRTALFFCHRASIAKMLIKAGADVNARDETGWTPVSSTTWEGEIAPLKVLLEHGADVNTVDRCRQTALFRYPSKNRRKVARLLLDRGADVNAVDGYGNTPLINACRSTDSTEYLQVLLEYGANVNHVNLEGETALALAAQSGHFDCVSWLLRNGAYIDFSTKQGRLTLPASVSQNHVEMVREVLHHGPRLAPNSFFLEGVLEMAHPDGQVRGMLEKHAGDRPCEFQETQGRGIVSTVILI